MADSEVIFTSSGNWEDYISGPVLDLQAEVITRDTIPAGFKGKLDESSLALVDCGELVYVASQKQFYRRGRIKNPPAKPEGKPCPGDEVETIALNEAGGVVIADLAAAASGAAGPAAAFVAQNALGSSGISATTEVAASGTSGQAQFCNRPETRVSYHTCNSQFPATAIDAFGNIGIAWHDTRDGVHEIYFKTLASEVSQKEAMEIIQSQNNKKLRSVNLNCFNPPKSDDPTKLVEYDASKRCAAEASAENSGVLARSANGRLAVNVNSRTITLSAESGDIDFLQLGIQPGAKVSLDTNPALDLLVSKVLSPTVLEAAYVDGATNASGFSFAILENPTFSLTSCETRLTCSAGTSVLPDVVVDSEGRYHVVYQSDVDGESQLYYIQVAPKNVGIKDKCDTSPPISKTQGFGDVPVGTPGSMVFTDTTDPNTPVEKAFLKTGENGDFFSYGNRFLVFPRPNTTPLIQDRTGIHRLFRDFAAGQGMWTGISLAADRATWDSQIALLGQSIVPEVVFGNHPIAKEGDFGARYPQKNVAFMVTTPPDCKVQVRTVCLPLIPRCSPRGFSNEVVVREQDLVSAPKRPMPPSFVDPLDLSQIMYSPNVRVDDSLPSRFVLEDDPSGVVYTNLIQEDARGQFWRLYFRKDTEKDSIKFLLGQQRCGDDACAAKVPDNEALDVPPTSQYKIGLQVWQGSDYRLDPAQASSAQMAGFLLFEKEFLFGCSEEISAFVFEQGELTLPEGSFVFFVPKAGSNTEFMTQGVGGGNDVWTTNSDGFFDRFAPPYTIKPYSGLKCPAYYDGSLLTDLSSEDFVPAVSPNVISTRTALVGASIAFGQMSGTEGLITADVVSQAFTITEDRRLLTVIIRMAKGTAGGLYDDGSVIPADSTRNLLAELFDDKDGVPNVSLFSVTVPNANITAFDDSQKVPKDSDLANVVIAFNADLTKGTYHIVLSEQGDTDKLGRFWMITDINNNFPVGIGLWNPNRTKDTDQWRLLPGQVQLMAVFEKKGI